MTVLHVADDDVGVKDVAQTVHDGVLAGLLTQGVAHLARLGVIVPHAGPHALILFLRGIVVEAVQLGTVLTVADGVDILQQGVVRGNEQAVVAVQ